MGDTLRKAFHLHAMAANKEAMASYLRPFNVVLEGGGAAKLVNGNRMLLESHPGHVMIHIDVSNAFNELSRDAIVQRLGQVPSLAHMQRFMLKVLQQ